MVEQEEEDNSEFIPNNTDFLDQSVGEEVHEKMSIEDSFKK